MPDLAFQGDMPVRLNDGNVAQRVRALMRILQGKPKPCVTAPIGDVARWHGVSLKALHNLEERDITCSERGMNGVRFYSPEQQLRIEVALALRELGATAQYIREFLDVLAADRLAARTLVGEFLDHRVSTIEERLRQLRDTRELLMGEA